ncbi:hypothetical protein [Undibacterium sp. KW1]|uniref:hypothetical protein n=1 Tax=Undibacterium sp. KW1 TaxID=2058624 RepID=UPI001389BB1E|nr:hypothetical protein [Undibacterium sp. KW1]
MKARHIFLTGSLCLMTSLLAACGGGSSTASNPVVTPQSTTLSLRGTAAIGKAIADSAVNYKCRTGTGATRTAADGTFEISLPAGSALPCILETSNPANGKKLHALAVNTGVINLTPLTEMLSTRLMRTDMAVFFSNPDLDAVTKTLTSTNVTTAQTEIRNVLSGMLDTSSISDFYSTPLKAATSASPASGDAQDKILDTLNLALAANLYDPLLTTLAKTNPPASLPVFGRAGCLIQLADKQFMSCSGPSLWETAPRIDISPGALIMKPGSKQVFTAAINYPPDINYIRQPVTWQIVETDGGVISINGEYTAPSKPGTYHVRAQREDYPSLSTTALVVVDNSTPDFVPTLSVDRHIVNVMPGATMNLLASINYPPNINYIRQPVTWSVIEADGGSINLSGNYVAPTKIGTYHVKVQRDDFPSIYVVLDILVNYPLIKIG